MLGSSQNDRIRYLDKSPPCDCHSDARIPLSPIPHTTHYIKEHVPSPSQLQVGGYRYECKLNGLTFEATLNVPESTVSCFILEGVSVSDA